MRVRVPRWAVIFPCLVAPVSPPASCSPSKHLKVWTPRTRFNNLVLLVRLTAVFALTARNEVHLGSTGSKRASMFALYAEQNQLRHIAEIEAYPASIGPAILPDFVPNDIALYWNPQRSIT
jgi:hypothetical protein